jgi:hypothetical protein
MLLCLKCVIMLHFQVLYEWYIDGTESADRSEWFVMHSLFQKKLFHRLSKH